MAEGGGLYCTTGLVDGCFLTLDAYETLDFEHWGLGLGLVGGEGGGGGGGTLDWTHEHLSGSAPAQCHDGQQDDGWWPTFPISNHLASRLEVGHTPMPLDIFPSSVPAPSLEGAAAVPFHTVSSCSIPTSDTARSSVHSNKVQPR